MPTLIIVNPHAAGGRALNIWSRIEPLMWETLGDLVVAVTEYPEEVATHLEDALAMGLKRIITVGGDGTNHVIINALADLMQQNPAMSPPILGSLPIGTGRDWARTTGVPLAPLEAVRWLAEARSYPVDLGRLTHQAGSAYFLNIASAGISGEVDRRVNTVRRRRPWTFIVHTVSALLRYRPRRFRVFLDGELWFEDHAFAIAVANGRAFGHGMLVAPNAQVNDGLFDVIAIEGMRVLEALRALPSLYQGTHLKRPDVHQARAADVFIESPDGPLDIDLDGEYTTGQALQFTIQPRLLQMLRQPLEGESQPD